MSAKHISLIYFYLVSAAALALIVIGIFNSVNFAINTLAYKDYPLRYREYNCQQNPYAYPLAKPLAPVDGKFAPTPGTPSAKEVDQQVKLCQEQQTLERKQQMLDDLKSALTFSLIGLVLFLIHFPQARKHSRD